MAKRVFVGVGWFIVIFLCLVTIGVTLACTGKPASVCSIEGAMFGEKYGGLMFLASIVLAVFGSARGILPWTKDNQRQGRVNAIEQGKSSIQASTAQIQDDTCKCPYCAETIKREARLCRYCGREITGNLSVTKSATLEGGDHQIMASPNVQQGETVIAKATTEVAMNCPSCGNQIPEQSKFCRHCGKPVDTTTPAQAVTDEGNTVNASRTKTQSRNMYKVLCGIAGAILVPFFTRVPHIVYLDYCQNEQWRISTPNSVALCMQEVYMPLMIAAVIGLIAGVIVGAIADSVLAKK